MDLFSRSWTALRTAVAELPDEDFAHPSGCTGWLVRDLVCHLIIDAQDVLITLVTPAESEPTRDAVTYWDIAETPPTGDDPLDALIVRLAAAYEEPQLLKFHFDDVGSAAGRRRTRRPGPPGQHARRGPHRGRLPLRVRPGVDTAPPRPDHTPPGHGRATRGGPRPVTRAAGEDRRGGVPRVVLRQGHAAGRHRTACPDRRGQGRTGRPGRETPARPRMIVWLHGTFGAGKTTTAPELVTRLPDARIFDAKHVGFLLRQVPPEPPGDFQHLPPWRPARSTAE